LQTTFKFRLEDNHRCGILRWNWLHDVHIYSLLAFENATVINNAKFMILTASLVAGMVGYFYLKFIRKVEVIEVE